MGTWLTPAEIIQKFGKNEKENLKCLEMIDSILKADLFIFI